MKKINLILVIAVAATVTYSFSQSSNTAIIGLNIGNKAPELNFWNPDTTQQIALSSLQGKIVLVDFWASWCGPCRIENPNVVSAYKKYKNAKFPEANGFEVYSVSLDLVRTRWVDAIEKDDLEWQSHVSDLKGWNSEPAKTYSIYSIPNNYLIDANGIIVAKGLRGENLHNELEKLLNVIPGFSEKSYPLNNKVEIFPNPTTGALNIIYGLTCNKNSEFFIYNSVGKKLQNYELPAVQYVYSISDLKLENGVYFYGVSVEQEHVVTGKIVVIR